MPTPKPILSYRREYPRDESTLQTRLLQAGVILAGITFLFLCVSLIDGHEEVSLLVLLIDAGVALLLLAAWIFWGGTFFVCIRRKRLSPAWAAGYAISLFPVLVMLAVIATLLKRF